MGLLRVSLLAAAAAVSFLLAPSAGATTLAKPPVVWLKGEGNYTKAHRTIQSIDKIVVHVTEGAFWGSVRWLQSPRAHASSHYVVSRRGKIVQLVHLSDVAWHAGNWNVNTQSVGIEHEGFTYGPGGFTNAQYHASARLAGWIARRSLLPITRKTIIGHAEVPAPGGGRGGSSHHTDPGPRWKWDYYLRLVRRYAGAQTLSVLPVVPNGTLRGVVPWRAKATGDIGRVEFSVDGRVVAVDRRAPFALAGGLNTTKLGNGTHVLQVHGVAGPGRYDIARRTVVIDNKDCRFSPHVVFARVGQPVVVKNSDPVAHNSNITPFNDRNSAFNRILAAGASTDYTFKAAESLAVPVACNVHPWMRAFVIVREDPYAAVSQPDGTFEIKNLPVGKFDFQVRHDSGYITKPTVNGKQVEWQKGIATLPIKAGDNDLGEIRIKF